MLAKRKRICYNSLRKRAARLPRGKLHIWGRSSAGRAPHWQCGGHRFDPDRLHHIERLQTKSLQSFCLSFSKQVCRLRRVRFRLCLAFLRKQNGHLKGALCFVILMVHHAMVELYDFCNAFGAVAVQFFIQFCGFKDRTVTFGAHTATVCAGQNIKMV